VVIDALDASVALGRKSLVPAGAGLQRADSSRRVSRIAFSNAPGSSADEPLARLIFDYLGNIMRGQEVLTKEQEAKTTPSFIGWSVWWHRPI
jgi:hypothetical protein